MNKKITLLFIYAITLPNVGMATEFVHTQHINVSDTTITNTLTPCATNVFENALSQTANTVSESDTEEVIEQWIQSTLSNIDNIKKALACPEFSNAEPTDVIEFDPIKYTFPMGREISVNYATQPNILQHKITLSQKRDLPPSDPNARIGEDGATWTNTNPAWYGIMVVEHGALDNFVGPDKNNTISLAYIKDNIDNLYPRGETCTSKSAIAWDVDAINDAGKLTTGDTEETNDFYVAGDINLQWISYAEMALDVALTVATIGGGAVILGATKATRAAQAGKTLVKSMRKLAQTPDVAKYIKQTNKLKNVTEKGQTLTKQADELADTIKKMKNIDGDLYVNTEKILEKEKEIKKFQDEIKNLQKTIDNASNQISRNPKNRQALHNDIKRATQQRDKLRNQISKNKDEIKKLGNKQDAITEKEKELKQIQDQIKKNDDDIADINKQIKESQKSKDIQQYDQQTKALKDLDKYRDALRAGKKPQTGNVIARNAKKAYNVGKSFRAIFRGNKEISRALKMGRTGKWTTKVRSFLFDTSLQAAGMLGKAQIATGTMYAVGQFLLDTYDYTETSTGEFTNNIDFAPLLLLSADDIPEQENVVNYGMWLLWAGDSFSAADDDAAYLQTMDFATKFHEDLMSVQDNTNSPCNVDIFVVRPIIRNIGTPNAELYYLIMNDYPWTTNLN